MGRIVEAGKRSAEFINTNKLRIVLGASLLSNAGLIFDAGFNNAHIVQGAKHIISRELQKMYDESCFHPDKRVTEDCQDVDNVQIKW